jgi:hypothetical protein
MQNMSADKAAEMQTAVEKALQSKESNGQFISPEEYGNLQAMFVKALDESKNLTTIANKNDTKITKPMNRPY